MFTYKKKIKKKNEIKQKIIDYYNKSQQKYQFKNIRNKKFQPKRKKEIYNKIITQKKFNKKEKDKKKYKYLYISKSIIIIFLIFLFSHILLNLKKEVYEYGLIKIGFYCNSLKYGGVERVMALLVNYLSKEKYFTIYLITISNILNEEYPIPNNTKRISLSEEKISIFEVIEREHLDILIYNFYIKGDMDKLNKLNTTKVIFYNHSSFLFWIYFGLNQLRQSLYQTYQNCKYVISLIPVENDYLFKKWGINSILMSNPSSFEYNSVTPSDLSNKNIIMIGRIDPFKRYELGVQAMEKIIKEIPECQMNIISDYYSSLNKLIKKLKLENNIRFTGYQKNIDIYLKNASLHIFPSISESYGLVLSEAKIYGIPTIMCGLDYLALADGGTVIIYDDNPETIAKEALKILKDDKYRKKLGKEARESMKNRKNILIAKRWVKLLLSVYKGDYKSYNKLRLSDKKLSVEQAEKILKNQYELLKNRKHSFKSISFEKFILMQF